MVCIKIWKFVYNFCLKWQILGHIENLEYGSCTVVVVPTNILIILIKLVKVCNC